MYSITSKLNSTFRTIGKPTADKMSAKVVGIINWREELIWTRCHAEKLQSRSQTHVSFGQRQDSANQKTRGHWNEIAMF